MSPALDRGRVLLVGRIVVRRLAAGGAAAARELAAERERRSEVGVAEAAPAFEAVGQGRAGGLIARCVYGLFVLALVCLTLVALNVDLLLPAGWRPFFRLVFGGVLVFGGLPLAAGRAGGRSRVIAHFLRRRRRRRSERTRVQGWSFRVLDPLLQAVGVVMLGAAAFELARAVPRLV